MNTLRKSFLIGLTVLGMGATTLSVHADEGRNGFAAKGEEMSAKMAEHFAKREAKLHTMLKLTAAQEPAWTAYTAAIKPPATPPVHRDRAAIAAMSAPERIDAMIADMKAHTTTMEAHAAALKTFYAVLTAEQKKVFDDNVMGGAHGPHHMGHMGRH